MGRYTEHLAGNENLQEVIRSVTVGTPVKLTPQPEHELGPRTIAAIAKDAGAIGYVASDWLKSAMLDDGTPVASRSNGVPLLGSLAPYGLDGIVPAQNVAGIDGPSDRDRRNNSASARSGSGYTSTTEVSL